MALWTSTHTPRSLTSTSEGCNSECNDLGHVLGAQGSGQHAEHHAGACMKPRHQVGNRKAPGLAKMVLQRRGVSHRKTRALGPKVAMAQPAALVERLVWYASAGPPQHPLKHTQRPLPAGLAIRRGGDGQLSQMSQMRTGGIAMTNLAVKELSGDNRIEQTLSPLIADVVVGAADGFGLKLVGPIVLKLFDHMADGPCHR
jgi:hypothetical protein